MVKRSPSVRLVLFASSPRAQIAPSSRCGRNSDADDAAEREKHGHGKRGDPDADGQPAMLDGLPDSARGTELVSEAITGLCHSLTPLRNKQAGQNRRDQDRIGHGAQKSERHRPGHGLEQSALRRAAA